MDIINTTGGDVAFCCGGGALTICTRHEWKPLPEYSLFELFNRKIIKVFKGTESVFFLLRDLYPAPTEQEKKTEFCLVRVSADEDGKLTLSSIFVYESDAELIAKNGSTWWEN